MLFLSAVSVTKCDQDFIKDGSAILKHSIHLSSYPIHYKSKYAYKMYAFIHTSATDCAPTFEELGYDVLIRETPINATDIVEGFYREHVVKSGCCGDKEFLKLYAYTLTDHQIVVHFDLDSIMLQPFDHLYDAMLKAEETKPDIPVMFGESLVERIDAYFTRDYNMVQVGHKYPGIQGGFLVVRPNMEYFEEYKSIIIKGNFQKGRGWDGKYGGYFGSQQIQGLCSYFYDALHPGTAVELNRCFYNQMRDSPYGKKRKSNEEACRDGRDNCEDCRETPVSEVKSAHFTLCQKPWVCPHNLVRRKAECRDLHQKWFHTRADFEKTFGFRNEDSDVDGHLKDIFGGYCKGQGSRSYIPIDVKAL